MTTFIGVLCKRGHDCGNGKSLRYVGGRNCVKCSSERKQRSDVKSKNREYMRERNQDEDVRISKKL